MARRDEVWERKRQDFLARQGGGPGAFPVAAAVPGCSAGFFPGGGAAPTQASDAAPSSPLSRLMRDGYSAPPAELGGDARQSFGMQAYAGQAGGSRGSSRPGSREARARQGGCSSGGFGGGVAQQWSGNVQQNLKEHQQQNDPTFSGVRKPSGYRVTQAPGGGSSISLSWSGDSYGGDGAQAPSPGMRAMSPGMRAPSPPMQGSPAGVRGASPGGMAPRRPYQEASSPAYGAGSFGACDPGAGGGFPPPLPRQTAMHQQQHHQVSQACMQQQYGQRPIQSSSNAYATGSNQNCGNYITDRRTTRVLAPPGGGSSISFG
eukprot:TRINITY_DN3723_c0_g1_i1.p1 TRINITY_DN3723_c0_g1~~TRINITY_DN3723_c0_g1_i1.p1  ORF type:complete len:318 (-),score=55.51 TRINITY_DN3723_c0_g1_i1:36-989(-)